MMQIVALVKDERYLEHKPGDGHPESPARLHAIHDLIDREFNNLPIVPPRSASLSELRLIHDSFYIQTVANLQNIAFSRLDADTALSARSYEIALLAAGGMLQAVDAILNPNPGHNAPRSIFAFLRPPGHHAEPARGMGFCLFNNVAIAAAYAKEKYGLKKILIVDWDLHHGNGTQRAFYNDPTVLYFSSHQYPHYPGTGNFNEVGSGKGEGFTVNAPFSGGFGDAEYIHVYREILKPIAIEYRPDLVLVSAGFDPYIKDPLGGMAVTGEGFGSIAQIIQDIADLTCKGKMVFALEGGYSLEGLKDGVRSVLKVLLGQPPANTNQGPAKEADLVIEKIVRMHKQYWKSLP